MSFRHHAEEGHAAEDPQYVVNNGLNNQLTSPVTALLESVVDAHQDHWFHFLKLVLTEISHLIRQYKYAS